MTQAAKGTFLQLPSVFIETCDLPETAQIMYIRMLHNFGYKGIYTGSLRKLANLVRMSKSTVDRMLNVLSSSHLISRGNTEASETAQSILQISLDPEYLWNANIDYCTSHTVPIWDSIKEGEVSQDGTECPKLGRAVPPVGQSVPTRTLKRAPNITKTNKTSKDILVVSADAESDGGPSAFLDKIISFEETLEEVQQQEEDRVIIDHLPNGQQVIRRTSGRPLGEIIPVGADIQEAIRDLISVEGTRGEVRAHRDGKAPLTLSASPTEEVGSKEPPRVVALLDATTPEPTEKNTEPLPTQIALLPAVLLSSKGAVKTPSPDKTVERKESKKSFQKIENCSPEIQARRRKWQEHFNQRRGGDRLSTQGECSNESRGIASLVDTYSDGQIEALDHYYYVTHPFWSKPENRRDISGYKLWQKASTARETLKERGRWPERDAPPGQALPQAAPSQQEDVYTRKIRELAAESAARYTTPHMQGVAL